MSLNKEKLEQQCKHVSNQEKRATDAERESIKYKQVEYIQSQVGQVVNGVIGGFNDRGAYIELVDTYCEGFAPIDSFPDFMIVDPSRLRAKGTVSQRVYSVGDTIRVLIESTDLGRRQVNLAVVDEEAK